MDTITTGSKNFQRPKTVLLPRIPVEGTFPTIKENRSPLFKTLSQEDLLSPTSADIVHTWLLDQPETNKRVQFARENNHERQSTSSPRLPSNLPKVVSNKNEKLLPSSIPEIKIDDKTPKTRDTYLASTTEAKFYRTTSQKAFSVSSATSSVLTRSRHAAFIPSSTSPLFNHHAPSEGPARSYISTSTTVRDRPLHLSSLDFNPILSESDRKKFDEICQQVPDEFEQLLPTLLHIGVVLWPKQFFDSNAQLTIKERKQRQRLLTIIDKDKQDNERQRHFHRLYGSALPSGGDILHKHHLLRENLSFQGQLSLLSAYRDAIESELTKQIPQWKSIPMRVLQPSFTEETHSVNRSSILATTLQAKQKFLRKNRAYSIRSESSIDDSSSPLPPEEIDDQWQKKSLVKIIEQGMNVLDETRKLSEINALNNEVEFELKAQNCVRKFKRWLFLWSTLFTDDKLAS